MMPVPKKVRRPAAGTPENPLPAVPKELLEQFLAEGQTMSAEAVQSASMAFKKALIERALGAELSHHLGYPPGSSPPPASANHRNGSTGKMY